ncbi:Rho termination factor, N-terminal domain [Neorhodopirellula lusitana]|uniref:Rho termination factor, N-terminal domain n=1 Tax=Neorhodopirellula lusitana TaxID=445327 RepID=A0ABY1QAM1_9BACT|nr:Rho termination factor N-terminal domain-containing protein [Neorhodopirellula lusitana]SMP64423.1 Rho termination factor, N-terminal domain [Neorhodopirellula lusitana]
MTEWTDKDERQYEHIKESQLESGKSEDTAQEVAARTVNKQRREEGRTPNSTTQGTGNPNASLEDRTVNELRNRAAELDIAGRSKMKKAELVEAIRQSNS